MATQVLVARLIKVAPDHCALSLRPGVPLMVTPAVAVIVVCPTPV